MLLQYASALEDCNRAITLDPTFSKAYFRKATALRGLGNIDSAIDALSSGLTHDPTNSVANSERTNLLAAKEQINNIKTMVTRREFRRGLQAVDTVMKDVGSANRVLNLLKIECLLELTRTEEAYNLSNQMVRSRKTKEKRKNMKLHQ